MLMNLRIIVQLTICLRSCGSTFAVLPHLLEKGSVRFSPQNNYFGEFESHSLPFRRYGHFPNKQKDNANVARLLIQVAKLNAEVEQLMQSRRYRTRSIHSSFEFMSTPKISKLWEPVKLVTPKDRLDTKSLLKALATVNGRSNSNGKGQCSYGGIKIGSTCYVVRTDPLGFIKADAACGEMNGILIEPPADLQLSQTAYSTLKLLFPAEFEIIENADENPKKLWIGYSLNDDRKDFESQGDHEGVVKTVYTSHPIFNSAKEGDDIDGAAITETGYWEIFQIDTKLPYACEFPLI